MKRLSPKNLLGDFVTEHPWISAIVGTAALGAAGWTGAMLAHKAFGGSVDATKAPLPPAGTSGVEIPRRPPLRVFGFPVRLLP